MKVWLYDIRPAPDGWVHVKTAHEAIELLDTQDVEEISLDNDLGPDQPEGYTVMDYIESRAALRFVMPPKNISIHTGNPVARMRMERTIQSVRRFEAIFGRCVMGDVD